MSFNSKLRELCNSKLSGLHAFDNSLSLNRLKIER